MSKDVHTFQIMKGVLMTVRMNSSDDEPTQTISIDADAEMKVPYHFHLISDEYLAVTHGVVEMTVNGKTQKRTPEMGELYIPKRVRHAISKPKGVAAGWTARTLPNLPEKARFFRNFASNGPPTLLGIMTEFYREGDTAPVIGGDWTPDWLCQLLVVVVGGFFGNFLGLYPPSKFKDE